MLDNIADSTAREGTRHVGGTKHPGTAGGAARTRRWMLATSATIAGALASACGTTTSSAPATQSGSLTGKLRFMTRSTATENPTRDAAIAAFKKKHPNLTIEGEGAENMRTSLTAQGAAGDFPDVLAAWDFLFVYTRGGHVQPLDDLVKRDKAYKLDAYDKEAVDYYRDTTQGNPLYALPAVINSYLIFYNRELFQKNNVKLPAEGWTWDDLTAAAQRLTSGDGDSKVYGAANYVGGASWWSAVWQNGAEVITPDRKKITLDQPAGVEAIEWIANQILRSQVHPTPAYLREKQLNARQLFLAGRVAMLPDHTNSTPGALANASFDWDVAPMPRNKRHQTRTYSQGYAMGKASKNADAAWEFTKVLSGEESLRIHAQQGIQFPAHQKLAESLQWTQGRPPKTPKIMVDTLKYGRLDYFTHWTGNAESALNNTLATVWSGEQAPRAAVRLAQEAAQVALDKAMEEPLWK